MNRNKLELIHYNFMNGNTKDAVNFIDEYGLYDFFDHYNNWLFTIYENLEAIHEYYVDATVKYFRIKNR